jgi:hypothetical protein
MQCMQFEVSRITLFSINRNIRISSFLFEIQCTAIFLYFYHTVKYLNLKSIFYSFFNIKFQKSCTVRMNEWSEETLIAIAEDRFVGLEHSLVMFTSNKFLNSFPIKQSDKIYLFFTSIIKKLSQSRGLLMIKYLIEHKNCSFIVLRIFKIYSMVHQFFFSIWFDLQA